MAFYGRSFMQVSLLALVSFMTSFISLSWVLGSYKAVFTATNIVGPLTGLWASLPGAALALLLARALKWALLGVPFISGGSLYLPTLSAAWYWRSKSLLASVALPLICMAAFALHPVGGQAWVYSLYWLIPVTLTLFNAQSLFAHALTATFIQHAVGSVMWLYLLPSTPALWFGLLPIVILERLVFASGMVMTCAVVTFVKEYVTRIKLVGQPERA